MLFHRKGLILLFSLFSYTQKMLYLLFHSVCLHSDAVFSKNHSSDLWAPHFIHQPLHTQWLVVVYNYAQKSRQTWMSKSEPEVWTIMTELLENRFFATNCSDFSWRSLDENAMLTFKSQVGRWDLSFPRVLGKGRAIPPPHCHWGEDVDLVWGWVSLGWMLGKGSCFWVKKTLVTWA